MRLSVDTLRRQAEDLDRCRCCGARLNEPLAFLEESEIKDRLGWALWLLSACDTQILGGDMTCWVTRKKPPEDEECEVSED